MRSLCFEMAIVDAAPRSLRAGGLERPYEGEAKARSAVMPRPSAPDWLQTRAANSALLGVATPQIFRSALLCAFDCDQMPMTSKIIKLERHQRHRQKLWFVIESLPPFAFARSRSDLVTLVHAGRYKSTCGRIYQVGSAASSTVSSSGYGGVENELFFRDSAMMTMMLFGDAKKVVEGILTAF